MDTQYPAMRQASDSSLGTQRKDCVVDQAHGQQRVAAHPSDSVQGQILFPEPTDAKGHLQVTFSRVALGGGRSSERGTGTFG